MSNTAELQQRIDLLEDMNDILMEENTELRGEGWRLKRVGSEMPQVDVVGLLCLEASNQAEWAARHGVSPQYVNDVLAFRRQPGRKILDALGLEKIVRYRLTGTKRGSENEPQNSETSEGGF